MPVKSGFLAKSSFLFIISALFILVFFSGCTHSRPNLISPETSPLFYDEGDIHSLVHAIERQYKYISSLENDEVFSFASKKVSSAQLAESLKTFQEIIELAPSPLELDRIIKENFLIIQAGGRKGKPPGEMLVTGYFEPFLEGSLTKNPPFIYPLYAPPPDLVSRSTKPGMAVSGRLDDGGHFQTYWTREEIDTTGILEDNELVYLNSRFDAFLLHIQGSGKIKLQDGSLRSVQYRANNGHTYSSIGKLLVDEKKMALEDVNIPSIRLYLQNHPMEVDRILNHNKRYIFFGWGEEESPIGSTGQALTPGRSIAVDKNSLPMGAIAYLVSQKPVIDEQGNIVSWTPLQRFVFPQDTGAAIKGSGRVDLFWGNGGYAEITAGSMKEKGYLYFLVKNDFEVVNE